MTSRRMSEHGTQLRTMTRCFRDRFRVRCAVKLNASRNSAAPNAGGAPALSPLPDHREMDVHHDRLARLARHCWTNIRVRRAPEWQLNPTPNTTVNSIRTCFADVGINKDEIFELRGARVNGPALRSVMFNSAVARGKPGGATFAEFTLMAGRAFG